MAKHCTASITQPTMHHPTPHTLPLTELWKLVAAFRESYQTWMFGPLWGFDMEQCESDVPAWSKLAARLAKDLVGPPQT